MTKAPADHDWVDAGDREYVCRKCGGWKGRHTTNVPHNNCAGHREQQLSAIRNNEAALKKKIKRAREIVKSCKEEGLNVSLDMEALKAGHPRPIRISLACADELPQAVSNARA